jgi:predicted DNA-binding transcriptional regulator AlpA
MEARNMTSDPLLRASDAADYLGLSKATLAKWRVYGTGPAFLKVGARVCYRVSDINDWLDDHRYRHTAESETARNPNRK